jgi:hypothetical protein
VIATSEPDAQHNLCHVTHSRLLTA